jgi:hypothetical protein
VEVKNYIRARRKNLPRLPVFNSFGIASRASGRRWDRQLRSFERAGRDSRQGREKADVTVGKPYVLRLRDAVCRASSGLDKTRCRSELVGVKTSCCAFVLNEENVRARGGKFPSRQTSRFSRLPKSRTVGAFVRSGWAVCDFAFRTARRLVSTTTSRGKDDPHRAVFLSRGVEIYFGRSEFWTDPGQWRFVRATGLSAKIGDSKAGIGAELRARKHQ